MGIAAYVSKHLKASKLNLYILHNNGNICIIKVFEASSHTRKALINTIVTLYIIVMLTGTPHNGDNIIVSYQTAA